MSSSATSCCGIIEGENPIMGVSVIWKPVDLPRRASWACTQKRTAHMTSKGRKYPRFFMILSARYESISPSLHDSKEYDAPNTTVKWLVLRRLVLTGKGAVRSVRGYYRSLS